MVDKLVEVTTVMNAEDCIPKNIDPKGIKYSPNHIKGSALYNVLPSKLKDGKWEVDTRYNVPDVLQGKFTNAHRANTAIYNWLHDVWRQNDEQILKNKQRATAKPKETKPEDNSAATASG